MLLGLVYSYFKKPLYFVSTTFTLEDAEQSGGGMLGQYASVASFAGIDLGGSGGGLFQGDNILMLL